MAALTEQGFKRPIYAEILDGQIKKAKELFGESIETSEQTPLGKFIRITAYDLAKAYEDLEICYYSRFPNTASGTSLDRLCVFAGISRNPATTAEHVVKLTGTAGYVIPSEFLVGTKTNVQFYLENETTIADDGTATVSVLCTETGTIGNVPLGSIVDIVNPDVNVLSVEHISQVDEAVDAESDADLRERFTLAVSGAGSSTAYAIRGEVLRVTNVTDCVVAENASDVTDSYGRPPHSFEAYVMTDEENEQFVAEAIFRKKSVGIQTHGNITKTVTAEDGSFHTIKFSQISEKDVYVTATVLKNADFATGGENQIKQALVDYVETCKTGNDVLKSAMYGYIHTVEGVVAVKSIELSDGETSGNTVVIDIGEKARLSPENITIEVENYADNTVF